MRLRLTGGRLYDPRADEAGVVRDLDLVDGRISTKPGDPDEVLDISDCVVMAGGIDAHTHIGGGKVNIARMMLPEIQRSEDPMAVATTGEAGLRYLEMGYTACFEPAMMPTNARQVHMEFADTPFVDKGAYVMLGSDDLLLRMMRDGADFEQVKDYVAWTMTAARALAVKVVNPGGINAFKFNQRKLDLDEQNQHYGVTPREVLSTLSRAVQELGVVHPLHIHGCNLGVPGNVETTAESIRALEGRPGHFTHLQFHSYGTEGDFKFSSGAAELAELVNKHPNVSIDVGQIMFGQTVTESGDAMHQHAGCKHAHPNKWTIMDIECDAGCGVVPFRYRDKNFVNALQWAIGLELFLLVEDPWRVFLTTDHPNGAPFTSYPHLIKLLCDKSFRDEQFRRLHPEAQKMSVLPSIQREYTLEEIAIMTRAAPAKSLGLTNMGHLGHGAQADVVVYRPHEDLERMFGTPHMVFKDGILAVRDGQLTEAGALLPGGATHAAAVDYNADIERQLTRWFDDHYTMRAASLMIDEDEITGFGRGRLKQYKAKRSA